VQSRKWLSHGTGQQLGGRNANMEVEPSSANMISLRDRTAFNDGGIDG
jgi:hypothetical protein